MALVFPLHLPSKPTWFHRLFPDINLIASDYPYISQWWSILQKKKLLLLASIGMLVSFGFALGTNYPLGIIS